MRPGLVPGPNVDRVDVAVGMELAAKLGYNSPTAQMVVEYALMRHARGEEEGAQRTWLSYFPRDLTSWMAILARAITTANIASSIKEVASSDRPPGTRWPAANSVAPLPRRSDHEQA